jgi:hypothetical protein
MRTFLPTVAQCMHEKAALKSERYGAMTVTGWQVHWQNGISRMRDGQSQRERLVIRCCGARGMVKRCENMVPALAWAPTRASAPPRDGPVPETPLL